MDIWALAAIGDAKRIQEVLAIEPESVHSAGPGGNTPLHFAATAETVKVILENGANPGALDRYEKTPLRSILNFGGADSKAAIYLLEQTGEWNIRAACAVGETKKIKEFLKRNPKLPAESGWNGETPLNIAAHHGQAKAVKLLIDSGADVNFKTQSGNYALHLAAENNHLQAAKILIEHKANLFALDDPHQAHPKDWADFQGHHKIVNFLKKRMKL